MMMRGWRSAYSAKTRAGFALEQENKLARLRARYREVMERFVDAGDAGDDVFRSQFHEFHRAGVAFFNAFEDSIAVDSLLGADHDSTWYSGKAESASNVLGTIVLHFRVVKEKAGRAGRSPSDFWPSPTAYAAMQRIVKRVVRQQADTLRKDFLSLGLPTYGFDHDEKEKRRMAKWQKITGVCFGIAFVVVLLILAVVVPTPTAQQFFVFRTVLALAAGACAAMLTGFLNVEGRIKSLSIRAGAGLAVFVIVYVVNPPALVADPDEPTSESRAPDLRENERSVEHATVNLKDTFCLKPTLALRLTLLAVHRKLIEQNVAGKSPGRLRIGRQTDDPHAARQDDLELLDTEVLEEAVVVVVRGDLQRFTVLPRLLHQFTALTLTRGEKDLCTPPPQTPKNPPQRLREALARLPCPAVPPKPRVGLHILALIRQQWNDRPDPTRLD